MDDDTDNVSLTLPVIGKSKSATHAGVSGGVSGGVSAGVSGGVSAGVSAGVSGGKGGSDHRGTMADIFGNLVSDEELFPSQTPKNKNKNKSVSQSEDDVLISKTASTTPLGSDTGSEKDLSDIRRYPIPPESPLPSSNKSFGRNRIHSAKDMEVVASVSEMTACMAINAGLSTRKTVTGLSELAANSAIQTALRIGLAKRKSEDISNNYNIESPGCMEAVLAGAVTNVALESALKKTSNLSAVMRS
jgi:hypothetical protein